MRAQQAHYEGLLYTTVVLVNIYLWWSGLHDNILHCRKILRLLGNLTVGASQGQELKEIDNFLEANLDAKLVQDEIEINKKVASLEGDNFFYECRKDFSDNKD